tara:strand:- start:663 stop:2603 length:1941 start_codon:yes stop_codon:yes gene_type:complete
MSFSLFHAVAGGAKRMSERLNTLETDTKDLVKTSAGRIATEMANNRKERIKNRTDYREAANKLKSLGLGNAQIETVLQGGLGEADAFLQTVQVGATKAALENKQFNQENYIQNLFSVKEFGEGRTIDEQAEAFAQQVSPISVDSITDTAKKMSAGTKSLLGQVPQNYFENQLGAQVTAMGGITPASYTGKKFGEFAEGTYRKELVTPESIIALKTAEAKGQKAAAEAKVAVGTIADKISAEKLRNDREKGEIRKLEEYTKFIGEQTLTERTSRLLTKSKIATENMNVKYIGAKIDDINKGIEKTDAVIEQIGIENNLSQEKINMLKAQIDGQIVDNDLNKLILESKPEELKIKLEGMVTQNELVSKQIEKLDLENQNIPEENRLNNELILSKIENIKSDTFMKEIEGDLLQKYGAEKEELALRQIESVILKNNRFSDLEEYQTALYVAAQNETNPERKAMLEGRADNLHNIINKPDGLKPNQLSPAYNSLLKNSLTDAGFEIDFQNMEEALVKIKEGNQPEYFAALASTIRQFESIHAPTNQETRSKRFVRAKKKQYNNLLKAFSTGKVEYSGQEESRNAGQFQLDANNNLVNMDGSKVSDEDAKKFDGKVGFIKYSDDSGQEIEVYGIFKDGDFLSQSVEDLMEY